VQEKIPESAFPFLKTPWELKNILIEKTICSSVNCLMKLLTPVNDYNLKVDISIENLQVVSTDCSGLTSLEIESVKNALIFVEFANKVKI